ncbi:MAG: transcriptional regulator, partial [bacterium]
IISCELQQLPAPRIDIYEENTKVTLFSKVDYFDLAQEDRLRSCYMHACIKYIQGEFLTNSSLRERFGLEYKSSASVSRLIKDACEMDLIKKQEETAPRHTKYVPAWA